MTTPERQSTEGAPAPVAPLWNNPMGTDGFEFVEYTGLTSRALSAPCGKIRIPINESKSEHGSDQVDQIQEFIQQYRGEGIQHIACGARDVYKTVEALRAAGLPFMPSPPDTYFEKIDARLPQHGEDIARLKRDGILIDGEGVVDGGHTKLLLPGTTARAFST